MVSDKLVGRTMQQTFRKSEYINTFPAHSQSSRAESSSATEKSCFFLLLPSLCASSTENGPLSLSKRDISSALPFTRLSAGTTEY